MKTVHLTLPVTEQQVRELEMGDIVYLSGYLYTLRDMAHRRAVDWLDQGKQLPVDLSKGCLWHCGPICKQNAQGQWEISSAGSTTSSRFSILGAELIRRLGLRVTLGKGTLEQTAVDAMHDVGSVFLNSTGGCAALYAEQIEALETVHWYDLGMPEAIWVMRVKDMGPFIVGIDTHGNSLYKTVRVKIKDRLDNAYEKYDLDNSHIYSYLPKRTPGKMKTY